MFSIYTGKTNTAVPDRGWLSRSKVRYPAAPLNLHKTFGPSCPLRLGQPRSGWWTPVAILVAAIAVANPSATAATSVSFNNQIQPILSEHCYHCHGPDSAARKPKKHPLRLDREQFAFEARDEGKPVIIKGDPEHSELVRRITATDDDVMPPASEHKELNPDEIAVLKKW